MSFTYKSSSHIAPKTVIYALHKVMLSLIRKNMQDTFSKVCVWYENRLAQLLQRTEFLLYNGFYL